jgi:hypothetical protein
VHIDRLQVVQLAILRNILKYRSQVEESDCRWRRAISGGGEQSQVEGSDRRGGEGPQVEWSDRRWRRVIAGGGERLQVEGSDRRMRRVTASGGKLS